MRNNGRETLAREIASLEAELGRSTKKCATKKKMTAREEILSEIRDIEKKVAGMYMDESSCGESFMDDEFDTEELEVVEDFDDEDLKDFDYEDEDETLEDESLEEDEVFEDESLEEDMDDEFMCASEDSAGVEDEITQDYLDDVLKEKKAPGSIDTEESMLETAPTGYVAKLRSASARLDKIAGYLEKQGNKKMAFRIDKIADAIDSRIQKEVQHA